MECELCGRTAQLENVEIEGTVLPVCPSCAKLGKKTEIKVEVLDRRQGRVDFTVINPDFPKIVRKARESASLSFGQLAEKIKESQSVIERIERGMRPTDSVARKLENALKIKLLGYQEVDIVTSKSIAETKLGDVAIIKKKKIKPTSA